MLVSVTGFAAVVVPTVTVPNDKLTGDSESGAKPLPVIFTSWGEFAALLVRVISPERLPGMVGVNVTVMVQ